MAMIKVLVKHTIIMLSQVHLILLVPMSVIQSLKISTGIAVHNKFQVKNLLILELAQSVKILSNPLNDTYASFKTGGN